ncbi:MAG: toxic anion resistance protein [Epsilonproteobacteria bacterium]|nr:toxic anion resistance protein [Campylobacterota bacterium]NPA57073.1 toxic anion resistance protein [Campylobacterota bacterium]
MENQVREKIEHAIIKKEAEPLPPVAKEEQELIEKYKEELDYKNRNSVIYFGVEAQEKLDEISTQMIEGVKNKDIGEAGETLNKMVAAIRGFDIDELKEQQSWWRKLLGLTTPVSKFIQQYEEVRDQIDTIANNLERHKSKLMSDLVSLEKLYEANLDYFRKLELYIKAGEEKLKELDEKLIPQFEEAAKDGDMLKVQELREIREFRNDLERRVHDLKLSRQVAMQALPSIRLIQENDKALINKITSTLVNTVPLWRNQLAQTITIYRSKDAAKSLKEATDLTNELLEKNAETLKEANREVKTQVERGVFDIESVKKANQTLIETLNESLKIAQEGKRARELAEEELKKAEEELKRALLEIKAKKEAADGAV